MAFEEKKKKAKHMSDADKAMFIEVMKRYVSVIESKKHDNVIIKKKRSAWDDVHADFNAEATVPRTLCQLKVLWKDCKAKAKKAMSREKRDRIKTGGGNKDFEIDTITKTIVDMIPQSFESIADIQDDDEEEHVISHGEENSEKEDDPAQQKSGCSDGFMHEGISISEGTSTPREINSITSKKRTADPWQKKTAKRQCPSSEIVDKVTDFHSLKIKLLREEHDARMKLIDKQREFAETEHNLRIDILRKIQENVYTSTSSNEPTYVPVVENTTSDVYLNNISSMGDVLLCKDNLIHL